ncbi:MAG: hypothetical protein NT004_06440 [Bacteroidetes bacterium]|nr:hypothetical protein [Bacteroidota bacterium]
MQLQPGVPGSVPVGPAAGALLTLFLSVYVGIRHAAPSSRLQASLAVSQSELSLMLPIQVVLGIRFVPSC